MNNKSEQPRGRAPRVQTSTYFFIRHGVFSKHHVAVVYTKFEVKRSILEGAMPIQTENPVLEPLTPEQPISTGLDTVEVARS